MHTRTAAALHRASLPRLGERRVFSRPCLRSSSATSSRRGFRSLPAPGSNRRNTLSTSQGRRSAGNEPKIRQNASHLFTIGVAPIAPSIAGASAAVICAYRPPLIPRFRTRGDVRVACFRGRFLQRFARNFRTYARDSAREIRRKVSPELPSRASLDATNSPQPASWGAGWRPSTR